jgi:hypothetical protein
MNVRVNFVEPTLSDKIKIREGLKVFRKIVMRLYEEDVKNGKVAEPSSVPATSKR